MKLGKVLPLYFLFVAFLIAGTPVFAAENIPTDAVIYRDGVYEGSGLGFKNNIDVRVTVSDGRIDSVEILYQKESPKFWAKAQQLTDWIVEDQQIPFDVVSCATYSSNGIKDAVRDALKDAVLQGSMEADPLLPADQSGSQETAPLPAEKPNQMKEENLRPPEEDTSSDLAKEGSSEANLQNQTKQTTSVSVKSTSKKKQNLSVKTKTRSVSYTKLKKKKQNVKGTIVVTKSVGKLTCSKVKGAKALSIKSNGTVVVKKGTKKGTYSMKVKVSAAGNAKYKKTSKTVTVRIKVK